MIPFTVYDVETGRVLRTGFCQEWDVEMQARPGEAVYRGERLNHEVWKVIDGEKVEI